MVILLTGAGGFIGRRLADALARRGHRVICAVRDPSRLRDPRFTAVAADFTADVEPDAWLLKLAGVDLVINAAGILRERGTQTFDAIHRRGPGALFAACSLAGVRRVIQISALGADAGAASRYHRSKKAADDFLAGLPLDSVIVQPSLVYGPGGTSARLFETLAALPVVPVPGHGAQQVQPIHVEDLVAAIVAVVESPPATLTVRLAAVGPEALSLRLFLAKLRAAMRLPRARWLPVPMPLVRVAARAGELLPGALLDRDTLGMLERGNVADAGPITAVLGRAPRPVEEFVPRADATATRLHARLRWLLALLRISVAAVWIATGIVSLGLYPLADSYALLARTGVTGPLAPVMLFGAALLDLALGVATLALPAPRRRWLWIGQLVLMAVYTAIITLRLPEFWLHPYGPLVKNLPMGAAITALLVLEPELQPPPRERRERENR